MKEIIQTSKINKNRIFIPIDIRKRFGFKEDDKIIWMVNENGDLIIQKSEKVKIGETLSELYKP